MVRQINPTIQAYQQQFQPVINKAGVKDLPKPASLTPIKKKFEASIPKPPASLKPQKIETVPPKTAAKQTLPPPPPMVQTKLPPPPPMVQTELPPPPPMVEISQEPLVLPPPPPMAEVSQEPLILPPPPETMETEKQKTKPPPPPPKMNPHEWNEKVKNLKWWERISSKIQVVDRKHALIPVVENALIPRFFTIRSLVNGSKDPVVENVSYTAAALEACMDRQMAKKLDYNDLDSLEDMLDFSQQIENDDLMKSQIGEEKIVTYRKTMSVKLLTVLQEGIEAYRANKLPEKNMSRIISLWNKSLLNYRLIWKCHDDPQKRLSYVSETLEQIDREIEKKHNPPMDLNEWNEKVKNLKWDKRISSRIVGGKLIPVAENALIPRFYVIRSLIQWKKGYGYKDPVMENVRLTAVALEACMERQMAKKLDYHDLDSLEDTLDFSQQIENDDFMKSKIGTDKIISYRKTMSVKLLTVLKEGMEAYRAHNLPEENMSRIISLWKKSLLNYQLIWKCHEDPQKRLFYVSDTLERIDHEIEKIHNPPPPKPENPLHDPFLVVNVKEWNKAVRDLNDWEVISSEAQYVNAEKTLVPVPEKNSTPRFYFIRRLIRLYYQYQEKDYQDSTLDKIHRTAFGLSKTIESHIANKSTDLDSIEESIDVFQKIEKDSAMHSEIGNQQMEQFRISLSDRLITAMNIETDPKNVASVSKERLIKIRSVWQKSLLNYCVIWQSRDHELQLINKATKSVDRQIDKLERMEKKTAAIQALKNECQTLVGKGQDNLKALEALEGPYKKLTTTEQKDKELFDHFRQEYREINKKLADFNQKLSPLIGNLDHLSEEELDNIAGKVAVLYENEFTPIIVNFQNIMYYHRPFSHLLDNGEKRVRHNPHLAKEWWNGLDEAFRKKQTETLAWTNPTLIRAKRYTVPPAFGTLATLYVTPYSKLKDSHQDVSAAIKAFQELAAQNKENLPILKQHATDKKLEMFYEQYVKTDQLLQEFQLTLSKINAEDKLTEKEWAKVKFRLQQLMDNYEVVRAYHRQMPKPYFPFSAAPLPIKPEEPVLDFVKVFTPTLPFLDFYQSYAAPLCELKELVINSYPNLKKLKSCINKLFSDAPCKPRVLWHNW